MRPAPQSDLTFFGGYVEPGEPGYDALAGAREVMVERLLRARSPRDRAALAVEAACHGLVVEVADLAEGGGEAL
jgi:hypothetical protein